MDATQGIYMKSASVDAEISGDWNETTQNKTESTGQHEMNATSDKTSTVPQR